MGNYMKIICLKEKYLAGNVYLCSQKQNDRIMEEKTYKLSLQQLNDLVSDAVNTAIRKLDNLEIIDDDATDEAEKKEAVAVTQMDDEQYREAMDTMAKNRPARRPS